MKFKDFLLERSAKEISSDIIKISDTTILDRIDSILLEPGLNKLISALVKNKQFPNKTNNSISNYFKLSNTSPDIKIKLLKALIAGMITKPLSAGTQTISENIDSKYSDLISTPLFSDFCEFVGGLKDSKSSQGATGTGGGEVLLSILVKDGYLPNAKGDINIFGKGMELKSSNGAIAAFKPVDKIDVKAIIDKFDIIYKKIPKNLSELIAVLITDKSTTDDVKYALLMEFYISRATKKTYAPAIKNAISDFKKLSFTAKNLQTAFGKHLTKLYQKNDGWHGIVLFKKSENYLNGKISVAYNEQDFEKYMNFAGLNFTNGNQNAYLTASSK